MKKEIVSETIFHTSKRASHFDMPYTWGEVKKLLAYKNIELKDDDVVDIGFEEGYDHGDSSSEATFSISVTRNREETEKEFAKRKEFNDALIERNKKAKYEQYLKLKKEFEG